MFSWCPGGSVCDELMGSGSPKESTKKKLGSLRSEKVRLASSAPGGSTALSAHGIGFSRAIKKAVRLKRMARAFMLDVIRSTLKRRVKHTASKTPAGQPLLCTRQDASGSVSLSKTD